MTLPGNDDFAAKQKRLDLAVDTRKFEISLFWQRSLFFWGFISAAFVGFAALYKPLAPALALIVACFGLVCSVAWTLVNRGSKYWQENWEQKVNHAEMALLGDKFFARQEPVEDWKSFWLRARQFSVSKLTIALSDFTVLVWLVIILMTAIGDAVLPWNIIRILLPASTVLFVFFMICEGRSTKPSDHAKAGREQKSTNAN